MGQNNKARRAAKSKVRQQRARAFQQPMSQHPGASESVVDDAAVDLAIDGFVTAHAQHCLSLLLDPTPTTRKVVDRRVWQRLRAALTQCWQRGWSPLELDRFVVRYPGSTKAFGQVPQQLLRGLIADDLSSYAAATVHQTYREQATEIEARLWWPANQSALTAHAAGIDGSPAVGFQAIINVALFLLPLLLQLGELPTICPPPGKAVPPRVGEARVVDDRILERVRQLLAKAESSTFEAEAETFTAGAQALMARHSIDAAMLAASAPGSSDGPQSTRVYIYPPYEDPKVQLLTQIARANRCKTIWMTHIGAVSVVGFAGDLLAVEALFTSLLVQGTAAMQRHGSRQDRSGRSRTRSFRSSFLASFAYRIGERLVLVTEQETTKASAEAGARGANLLPVLAARDDQVHREFQKLFPHTESHASRASYDHEGWHAGRRAADSAELGYGGALTG